MEEALKEIQKEIQRAHDASGRWYAMRNDKRGSEYLHIAVGLEAAHKILVSNLLLKTEAEVKA